MDAAGAVHNDDAHLRGMPRDSSTARRDVRTQKIRQQTTHRSRHCRWRQARSTTSSRTSPTTTTSRQRRPPLRRARSRVRPPTARRELQNKSKDHKQVNTTTSEQNRSDALASISSASLQIGAGVACVVASPSPVVVDCGGGEMKAGASSSTTSTQAQAMRAALSSRAAPRTAGVCCADDTRRQANTQPSSARLSRTSRIWVARVSTTDVRRTWAT